MPNGVRLVFLAGMISEQHNHYVDINTQYSEDDTLYLYFYIFQ
jgi:hypothetical protein